MTEYPILFNGEMVRAILDGRKTQTRRILKDGQTHNPPYGSEGDRLWVRETWRSMEIPHSGVDVIVYAADHSYRTIEDTKEAAELWGKANEGQRKDCWRPSIFMPRWASRITLDVLGTRIERLQDITEEDAKAEGHLIDLARSKDQQVHADAAKDWFMDLWDSINAKPRKPGGPAYPWSSNPWVWVIEFRKVDTSGES